VRGFAAVAVRGGFVDRKESVITLQVRRFVLIVIFSMFGNFRFTCYCM
jgi:hypothetical protein